MPPQKSEQSITLDLKEFIPPPPPVIPPVTEEIPTPPEEPVQEVENTMDTYQLQEMTRRVLQNIANFKAKEINASKIAEKETEAPAKEVFKKPKETPVKQVKKETVKKTVKKQIKKPKKKVKKRKVVKKKPRKKKRKKIVKKRKRKYSNDPLVNSIMNASTSVSPSRSKRPAMRMIKQFYGSEFNSFTPTQKKFIEKNLGSIYRITQRTLTRNGYPSVAQRTHQQGTQIVTFYLHPNGAITGLRLKKRVGYASLDKNTLKVIRIAYKDYPRPKTKTKITFYVEYSLF